MKHTTSCLSLKEKASPCRKFILLSLLAVIFLVFCVGTVFLIAFLVVHPRAPLWDVRTLQITSFSAQTSNHSPVLNVDLLLNLTAHNRIKKQGLWYEPTTVEVFVFQELGGKAVIPSFHQKPQQTNDQQAFIRGRELVITRETEAAKLQEIINNNSHNSNRSVDIHVDVYVRAKVRILEWLKHHYKLRIQCDISVSFPQSGNESSLLSKTCEEEKHWLSHS